VKYLKRFVALALLLSLLLLVLGCGEQKTAEEQPVQEEAIATQADTTAPAPADTTAAPAPEAVQ